MLYLIVLSVIEPRNSIIDGKAIKKHLNYLSDSLKKSETYPVYYDHILNLSNPNIIFQLSCMYPFIFHFINKHMDLFFLIIMVPCTARRFISRLFSSNNEIC